MRIQFKASKKQMQIFWGVSIFLVLADQASKYWAQDQFREQPPVIYLHDFFRFEYAENPGAFLGMGDSLSDPLRFWIFSIFVLFLMIGLAIYLHVKEHPRWETWAYSLVFSGGIGNLIDRMFRTEGRVIDFMNMGFGTIRTGIFNLADVAIMGGLIILLFHNKGDYKKTV